MERVTFNGLHCWADSYRETADGRLVFLSLFGNHNAVRAVWANIVGSSSRRRRSHCYCSVDVGGETVRVEDGTGYYSIKQPIGDQLLHLILLHPGATQQTTTGQESFVVISPKPEVDFWPRLTRLCPIPLRDSWRIVAWWLGREANLIQCYSGFGVPAYYVDAGESWGTTISANVAAGVLR